MTSSDLACSWADARDPDEAWREYATINRWLTSRLYGDERPDSVHSTTDDLVDQPAISRVLGEADTVQAVWLDDRIASMKDACRAG